MKNFWNGIKQALATKKHVLAVALFSIFFYIAIITIQNFSYLHSLIYFSLPFQGKLQLFFTFVLSPLSSLSKVSFIFTSLAVILFSLQLVMLWYWLHIRRNNMQSETVALSLTGTLVGIFGIGCASCGSLLLTSVAASTGVAVQTFLPYGGEELPILACLLLALSVYQLAKKINAPFVC